MVLTLVFQFSTPVDRSEESSPTPPVARKRQVSAPDQKKEYVNIVFCGHVDAGKSTIGGQIM